MRIAIILMPVRIRIWIGINIEIRIHKDGDPQHWCHVRLLAGQLVGEFVRYDSEQGL
jgi:hypothetical protein